MGYVLGANSSLGGNTDVPGGSSASDDSLAGVSAALGTVPVAVSSNPNARPPGKVTPTGHGGLTGKLATFTAQTAAALDPGVPQFNIKTINAAILDLDKLTRAQKAAVQSSLYQAGYLVPTNGHPIVPGEIDTTTRAAYRQAVEDAARQTQYDPKTNAMLKPVTVDQVIHDRIANRQAQGITAGSLAAQQQPQVQLTNPADIRAQVLAEAKAKYGHKADDKLVGSIIDHFQRLQSQAQQSTAPTVTAPPDLSTFVTQQVQNANPTDVAANRALGVGNLFMQAFQSSAGQQPTPGSN